jgi:hypothetical protein
MSHRKAVFRHRRFRVMTVSECLGKTFRSSFPVSRQRSPGESRHPSSTSAMRISNARSWIRE